MEVQFQHLEGAFKQAPPTRALPDAHTHTVKVS